MLRENAETTKMRIVFDASAEPRKGALSLNDCLHTGPSLAPLLFDVLLHLREHQVILTGDIKKAFLQIEMDEADQGSVRFLCVKDPFSEASAEDILRFARVIFRAGPSPFLLGGTLQHHLKKRSQNLLLASDMGLMWMTWHQEEEMQMLYGIST